MIMKDVQRMPAMTKRKMKARTRTLKSEWWRFSQMMSVGSPASCTSIALPRKVFHS